MIKLSANTTFITKYVNSDIGTQNMFCYRKKNDHFDLLMTKRGKKREHGRRKRKQRNKRAKKLKPCSKFCFSSNMRQQLSELRGSAEK